MCFQFELYVVNFSNVFGLAGYKVRCHSAAADRREKDGAWPHVCASLELFHSLVFSTVHRFCQLVALGWGYTRSITITMHATAVAQCQEGDCRAGLGQKGFPNTSHCVTVHTVQYTC